MRPSGVSTRTKQLDLEHVRRRCERTLVRHHLTDFEATIDVTAKNRRDASEHPGLEDRQRAPSRLFSRLENYEDVAFRRSRRQQRRRSHRPRRVHVVPAGMHHSRNSGREWKPGRLLDWQRINVATNRDNRGVPVLATNASNDASVCHARHVSDANRAKSGGEFLGGSGFAKREFGFLMNCAAKAD